MGNQIMAVGWALTQQSWFESTFPSSRPSDRRPPLLGMERLARVGTGGGLQVTVVSAVSTRHCRGRSASSNLVGHSRRWWRNADAQVSGTCAPEGV